MRAITGAVVSSKPCNLRDAHDFISEFVSTADSYVTSSDCPTYLHLLDEAIREQHKFLRRCGIAGRRQDTAGLDAHGYEGPVEASRERQSGEKDRVPAGGHHGSVEEAQVPVAVDEKSKKRKQEEEPHEHKAVGGIGSHVPASPEILYEQRKKKEKHSNKELVSIVKQEPGLVVEEVLGSQKKGQKEKEKDHVKLEEGLVEVKGQVVNNGVADHGIGDGDKKRNKRKHSEEESGSKGVKEEKITTDSDQNSEKKKKKKKRGRGYDDGVVQELGEHKQKKQRKES